MVQPQQNGCRRLPSPSVAGRVSLEEAIGKRRSVREFTSEPLTIEQVSQLCWAAQGITHAGLGLRASPSAGALYPIEMYVVTADGVDRYEPAGHRLIAHLRGDVRPALQAAAFKQEMVGQAPLCLVITAVVERMAAKYGRRAERYCIQEAGHVGQNVALQAVALDLGTVAVGAYDDGEVAAVLKLPGDHRPFYLLPIGHPST